jgi:two-component system cell cycle sensor histidine kinase/response regulator CckA
MIDHTSRPEWAPDVELLPSPIASIDRSGRILYVNRAMAVCPVPGLRVGEVLFDHCPTTETLGAEALLHGVFEGRQQARHQAHVPALGRHVELLIAPWIKGDQVVAAMVMIFDTTEGWRAERALEVQEGRARALLRALPDMIFRLDREGHFLDYSGPEGATLRTPQEFLGQKIDEVLPPAIAQQAVAAIQRSLAAGQAERIEYQMEVAGKLHHYEARLLGYGDGEVLGIVRDVSELVRAQSAVVSSERSLIKMIEQIPDAILIHREGQTIYANLACARLLGFTEVSALVGRSIFDFIHADDRARVEERMRRMVETEQPAPPTELRVVRSDGAVVIAELAPVQFIALDGGRASLIVARDVTERKKVQEKFLLADRVASMGNLAAGLAHEINNPLTYVVGNLAVANRTLLELVGRSAEPRLHELLKAVADARAGAERVRFIVSDLRAFSTPDRGEVESVDLRKVLDSAINVAWSEIRHRARLVREYGDTPNVAGSGTRFGQLFLNLLLNAAQAIEREGDAAQHRIHVVTRTEGDGRAHVEIRDTGRGFTPEVYQRMWDPFYTTKPAGEGTGLGLPICQSIVTSVGGEIWAERNPQHGTVFHVALRPYAGDLQPSLPAFRPNDDQPLERGRILVVDDEPVIATMVRRVLDGHDVYLMTSGRDALELCRELEFDLILVDLLMPDLTGHGSLRGGATHLARPGAAFGVHDRWGLYAQGPAFSPDRAQHDHREALRVGGAASGGATPLTGPAGPGRVRAGRDAPPAQRRPKHSCLFRGGSLE